MIDTYKFGIVVIIIVVIIIAGRVIIVVSIPSIVAKVETVTPKRPIRFRG